MSDFKKLLVWQKAHALVLHINHVASRIRGTAHVSLKSQMVRAAMSIPANIVEGRGQISDREFSRYLRIALNSTSELEYHLIAARDVHAISEQNYASSLSLVVEVRKMLHGLIQRMIASPSRPENARAGS
jgi:four helix bundle protein